MVMRLSDSSTGVHVPALRPVSGIAITIAVLCAVMAVSTDVLAFWVARNMTSSVPQVCSVAACYDVVPPRDEMLAMVGMATSLTWVFAGLGVALAALLWIWRARLNAEVLSPVPPRLSRWWSVGCWFVPIANVVLPPLVLLDIWAASCAGRDPRDGYVPGIRLVRAWWVAQWTCVVIVALIVLVGERVVSIMGYRVDHQMAGLTILLAVVGHGAAALFAAVVLKISADQTAAMNLVGVRPRRSAGHVVASLLVLVLLVGSGLTAHREWVPPDCGTEVAPCPPTPTPTPHPPDEKSEPPLPAGRHPVVIHDCDLDSGYPVRETRNPPPDTGRTIDVHAIEVYQTRFDHGYREHPEGAADVYVHATLRPQVLMLKAYEPTLWRVHADEGVTIAMVVLDGYYQQRIEGVPADIEVVTPENWPAIPNQELALLAETPPASETYCYDASLFSVRPYTDEPGD